MANPIATLQDHFGTLTDPRVERTRAHELLDIVVIAICAVICGADTWVEVADFGRAKQTWLARFLKLPNGIPSHDTFGRVFARLDPEQFQASFLSWTATVSELTQGQVIAIDGKRLRRSHDKAHGKAALQLVSAWATANHLVLGQRAVDDQSNEITAIPLLLETLELAGCIVTIDAMGCQKEIAAAIVDQEADYVLALKKNHGTLFQEAQELFDFGRRTDFAFLAHDFYQTDEQGHGRHEVRRCWTLALPDALSYIRHTDAWPNLHSLIIVEAERRVGEQTSREVRFYLSSLPSQAQPALEAVRAHWQIENGLHWVLDISFREDDSRVRKDHAPANLALLRHIALNLLKQDTSARIGMHAKRLRAGWDEAYLLRVLAH